MDVLQSKLKGDFDDDDTVEEIVVHDDKASSQLKPISVTDLLGNNNSSSSPSILEILSKAKVAKSQQSQQTEQPEVTHPEPQSSLETLIMDKFKNLPSETSLKSFTNSVCQFIQTNPQLLASLHRQLINKKQ